MFDKPTIEATKEILRWVILLILSFLVTETLNQVNAIPETLNIQVWVFSYLLPVRLIFTFLLTTLGRFIDKWIFTKSKQNIKTKLVDSTQNPKGLLPF